VGATGDPLAGGDADHYFETSLATGSTEHLRILYITDLHNVGPGWEATLAAYFNFVGDNKADIVLTGGDNSGNGGSDAEWVVTLNALSTLARNTPIFFAPGNHDWTAITGSDPDGPTGPYFDLLTLPDAAQAGGEASGTEKYYSFDYGNVHFVELDHDGSGHGLGAHYNWAATDMAATTQEWTIVYGHIPPYSKCKRDSDVDLQSIGVREVWLPMMEPLGFDLMLSGHMHCYQRTYFINGHHGDDDTYAAGHEIMGGRGGCCGMYYSKVGGGPVANSGAVYMIASSMNMVQGGTWDLNAAVLTIDGDSNTAGAPDRQHSVVIDIQDQLMDVHVIRQNGQQMDAFQIRKTDP